MDILVVEDDKDQRDSLIECLELSGNVVNGARDGKAALELIDLSINGYDLIITDLVMPLVEGIELIRKLPAHGHEGGVIAVSAWPDLYLDMAKELGADYCLRKPLDLAVLQTTVREFERQRPT